MMPVRRPQGPSRAQIRRRRIVALVVALLAIAAFGAALWVALPHVRETAAPPPPPPPPPPPKPFRIVIPEGFTRAETAKRVTAVAKIAQRKSGKPVALTSAQYLAASRKAVVPCFSKRPRTNVEGFLFPATYDFFRTTSSRALVQQQIATFCRNWAKVNLAYARSKNLSPYDVLIIASMVEKETLAPDERRLVAAVIYNRLKAGMTLGIDATLRYGLGIPGTEAIRQSQLESDSPFNTRKRAGLTPTPIGNPGLASIHAAAHPAAVDYLYFVRKPDKVHHFFTASQSAFNQYACAHGYGCG
jgi:peptidoglycan lytic transglycosylase G